MSKMSIIAEKERKYEFLIYDESGEKLEVNRSFKLDYFNFPMVDNTRLSNNQRFAIVMEVFELKEKKHISTLLASSFHQNTQVFVIDRVCRKPEVCSNQLWRVERITSIHDQLHTIKGVVVWATKFSG